MIDIIIPAYNAHKYIKKTLQSIANQTIKDKLKITIIDDGSDKSYDNLLLPYLTTLNIDIIKLKKNHGQGYAKQIGINKTQQKYIFFIDADDILLSKTALENLLNKAKENKNGCIIAGKEQIKNNNLIHEGHMVAKLFKREFINKYKIKIPNFKREEDIAFTMSAYCLAQKNEIMYLDETIYKYCRINKNSITTIISIENGYDYQLFFQAIDYAYKYAKKYKKYDYFQKQLMLIFFKLSYVFEIKYKTKNIDLQSKFLRNCQKCFNKYNNFLKKIQYQEYNNELANNFYKKIQNYNK